MPVNKEKVISLIAEIVKANSQLKRYRALSKRAILSSPEKLNSIKYLFVVVAEACIDICQHLSAKLFSEVPESYASCFQVLCVHKVISASLAKRLGDLAGLRNLLVHRYWQVDDKRVVQHLGKLDTLQKYVRVISSYVGVS